MDEKSHSPLSCAALLHALKIAHQTTHLLPVTPCHFSESNEIFINNKKYSPKSREFSDVAHDTFCWGAWALIWCSSGAHRGSQSLSPPTINATPLQICTVFYDWLHALTFLLHQGDFFRGDFSLYEFSTTDRVHVRVEHCEIHFGIFGDSFFSFLVTFPDAFPFELLFCLLFWSAVFRHVGPVRDIDRLCRVQGEFVASTTVFLTTPGTSRSLRFPGRNPR